MEKANRFLTTGRDARDGGLRFLFSGPHRRRSAAHRNPTSVRRVAPPVHGGRRAGALASAACRRLRYHRRAPSTVRHALSSTLYVHRSTVTAAITALARARASSTVARLRRPALACPERSLRCRRRRSRLSARLLVSSPSGQSVVRSTAGRYDMLASVPSAAADRGQQKRIVRSGTSTSSSSSSGRSRHCGVIVA